MTDMAVFLLFGLCMGVQYAACSGEKSQVWMSAPKGVRLEVPCKLEKTASKINDRPIYTWSWRKDGKLVARRFSNGQYSDVRNGYEVSSALTLTINSTSPGKSDYECSVTFNEKDVNTSSRKAILHVTDDGMEFVNRMADSEAGLRLPCAAGESSDVTWFKQTADGNQILTSVTSGPDLIIRPATHRNSGDYICEASNSTHIRLHYVRLLVVDGGGLPVWAIAVIVIAVGVLVIGVAGLITYKCCVSRRRSREQRSLNLDVLPPGETSVAMLQMENGGGDIS